MKVELTVKTEWAETTVVINGNKSQVERIVDAIKQAVKEQPRTEIK